jgi:hypothetical protein
MGTAPRYTDAVIKGLLSRLSIRVTAPVLLVLPVLLAAGVLIAIGTIQGRAAVERLASQQLAQIHDQIHQHVEGLVSTPARVDQANIALLESGRFDPAAPRDWGPVLVEQFLAFEVLSAITWGGEDGQCTWVARYVGDDEHLYYAIKDDETGDDGASPFSGWAAPTRSRRRWASPTAGPGATTTAGSWASWTPTSASRTSRATCRACRSGGPAGRTSSTSRG